MKYFNRSLLVCVIAGGVFLFPAAQIQAAPADGSAMAKSGSLACGGSQSNLPNGNRKAVATWVLRNYDDLQTIQIDNISILDAQGVVIKSNPTPFNNVTYTMGPGQTLTFNSATMGIPSVNLTTDRPLQFRIDWSAQNKALTLEATVVVTTFLNDGITPFGRHAVHCRATTL